MKNNFLFLAILFATLFITSNLLAQDVVKYYYVKNYWTKTYLFGGQDFGCGGKKATPDANSWAFEPVPGQKNTYFIKHYQSGNYLNIETGQLDYGQIKKGWFSAQWVLEKVGKEAGVYRIKNRWKPTLYLNNEKVSKTNGVECTTSNSGFWSSYWQLIEDGF
jgi:hypothetical protein